MKFLPLMSSLVALAAAPAIAAAATPTLVIDFEKAWGYGDLVDDTYASQGVSFTNVMGVSNEADFSYFSNAPSSMGTAMAQLDGQVNTAAFMNVADGVDNSISFYFSSPTTVLGAVKAYAGLNGTGELLGTFGLIANDFSTITDIDGSVFAVYDTWTLASFNFAGTARSFDLTASANVVGFDNISVTPSVPEPESLALLLVGLGVMAVARRHA
jgi:hypothetical protein